MAETKKEKLLLKICRALITERGSKGITAAFGILGKELGLDGAFRLKTSEIPFLFEMKDIWEPKKRIAGRQLLLDYTGASDWKLLNPFERDENSTSVAISDASAAELDSITRNYAEILGVESFAVVFMREGNVFIGADIFFKNEPHEWTEDEINLLNEATELIGNEVSNLKWEESRDVLLEEAERSVKEANDATNQFMTNLSHEIRTPINAIIGMTSIMRHNSGNPEVMNECFDRMEKSSKQLMDTVNDCVSMTLVNSGSMTLDNTWIPLQSLVTSVKGAISMLAEGRRINFEADYDETLNIYADEVKLGRVLITALSNSCRNAEEDTNLFLTVTKDKVGNGNIITFRIRDEVAGIDEETAKHIFEPFGGDRSNETFKGIGLSMTLAKHFVEMMHGTIEFFSDGWGTELVIGLPLESCGGKQEEKPAERDEMSASDFAEMYIGRRILVAEDNVLMGEIIATILGYRGLETDIALNGQEAFDKFAAHEPFYYDMILMDIQMPVMDGIEAVTAIRNSDHADAEMIPIAALSANTYQEDIRRALDSGMNAYLRKPVSESELFETISRLVL